VNWPFLKRRKADVQASTMTDPAQWLIDALSRKSSSGLSVTPGKILGIAVVYACVNVISKCFATLPIRLYQGGPDGSKKILRLDPMHQLLAVKPNPEMTSVDFRRVMQAHLSLHNNAYAEVVRNGAGQPAELWPIHPANITPDRTEDGVLYYKFRHQLDGRDPLPMSDVLHLRGLTFDGIYGFDPVGGLKDVFGLAMALDTNAAKFFANDSKPGTILSTEQALSDRAYNRLKQSMEQSRGVEKAHQYKIFEEGLKILTARQANRESQMDESRARQSLEICRIYNVPPHKVQILDNATFSNIEEQQIDWVADCILPLAVTWESALARLLLSERDRITGKFFKLDLRGLMRGKMQERADYYSKLITAGVLSRNEARVFEDLDPIDGLDEMLEPMNMAPAGARSEQD
jgi:HK97 family phage portal protein